MLERPRMDLDSYISSYTGRTAISRLLFIHSKKNDKESLQLALKRLEGTPDIQRQQYISKVLGMNILMNAKAVHSELERLEQQLKIHRGHLVKESIRVIHFLLIKIVGSYGIGRLSLSNGRFGSFSTIL
jgi:hypothetical protein